jgi:hypothetical protein
MTQILEFRAGVALIRERIRSKVILSLRSCTIVFTSCASNHLRTTAGNAVDGRIPSFQLRQKWSFLLPTQTLLLNCCFLKNNNFCIY